MGDFREAKAVGVYTDYTTPPPSSRLEKSSRAVFTAENHGQMAGCSAGPASRCKGLQLPPLWVSWGCFMWGFFLPGMIIFHCHFAQKGRQMQAANPCYMKSPYVGKHHLFNRFLEPNKSYIFQAKMPLEITWTVSSRKPSRLSGTTFHSRSLLKILEGGSTVVSAFPECSAGV